MRIVGTQKPWNALSSSAHKTRMQHLLCGTPCFWAFRTIQAFSKRELIPGRNIYRMDGRAWFRMSQEKKLSQKTFYEMIGDLLLQSRQR